MPAVRGSTSGTPSKYKPRGEARARNAKVIVLIIDC